MCNENEVTICPHCGRGINNIDDFDPMNDVPRTDEQVRLAIVCFGGPATEACLALYEVLRAQGKNVLDAYKHTLLARVGKLPAVPD